MRWFRLYHSVLDSTKVRRLPDAAQLDYLLLLCCASEHRERTKENTGDTGLSPADAAWRCRRDSMTASVHLMERAGLVAIVDDRIVMHGWEERQRAHTDDSYERLKAWRQRKRDLKRHDNVISNVTETPSDTDTDTDTDTEKEKRVLSFSPPARTAKKPLGTRLPTDWRLPDDLKQWAMDAYNLDAQRVVRISLSFRDYWLAAAGAKARKADWAAAWRTWVRKEMDRAA